MNIGYIYKITNLINGKIYIGQTIKSCKRRWNEHKYDAFKEKMVSYNYPLYRAFRKYGIENFSFEILEECFINELDKKEIYYIKHYNSFYNGYNQTLGGSGNKLLELNEKEIIQKYKELGVISKVAIFFECNEHSIASILEKNNIEIKSAIEHQKEKGNKIFQYDLGGNLINIFNSRFEVGEWLVKNNFNNEKTAKVMGECFRSKFRIKNEFIEFGYFWKLEKPYDKEKYIKLKKDYYLKNKENLKNNYIKTKKDKCPICGNTKLKNSSKCLRCNNKDKISTNISIKEQKYKISREKLKEKIRSTSFLQIGREYGVSDNAIRKWCKAYNLPFKSNEIKNYTDEEWKNI